MLDSANIDLDIKSFCIDGADLPIPTGILSCQFVYAHPVIVIKGATSHVRLLVGYGGVDGCALFRITRPTPFRAGDHAAANAIAQGRRHLRRLVARLKFELGVPIALTVTAPALWQNPALSGSWAALLTTFAICLSAYLFVEAAATHDVLGRLRHELLKDDGSLRDRAAKKRVIGMKMRHPSRTLR